jgi:hypothetical protein
LSETPPDPPALTRKRLARAALAAFVLTFALSRILVLLIMSRRIPDLYLHVGQTHVHHLNYGIFLLSGIGAYLLLAAPEGRARRRAALVYGVGLGLTFDEFGMWIHLGGPYWQRASYDAIVVVGSLLALFTMAPPLKRFGRPHWATLAGLVVVLSLFAGLLLESFGYVDRHVGERLRNLEQLGPG